MPSRIAPTVLLVTPYLADANNGNWRTAARWARLLAPAYRAILLAPDTPLERRHRDAIAMVALHARRSRAAIGAWRERQPDRALVVVLTGTDLYRDLPARDAATLRSLHDAHRLVVLQPDATRHVPADVRAKVDVVYQSARTLAPFARKATQRLHCVFVAHLRDEKDPRTLFAAWRRLPRDLPATLSCIGASLDAALADEARALAASDPRVQLLGARPHPWTRQAIRRAHVLIVPSRMEGGANVVVEAVTAATPVLASRMSGNVGMLGDDYAGYFDVGDPAGLADAVVRSHGDRDWLARLTAQCARRAPLFSPAAEASSLVGVLQRACDESTGRMKHTLSTSPLP